MARPPLLTLSDIRLTFGGKPLFEGVDLVINKGERAALIGRNGAGKSTLMKIVAGRIEADEGNLWTQPGTRVVFAEQEPDLSGSIHSSTMPVRVSTIYTGRNRSLQSLGSSPLQTQKSNRVGNSAAPPSHAPLPLTRTYCCSTSRPIILMCQ